MNEIAPTLYCTDVHRDDIQALDLLTRAEPIDPEMVGAPFAKLDLGQRTFVIAEPKTSDTFLCFHDAESGTWLKLPHTRESGWKRIAADIMLTDPDVLRHFLQTHAVKVSGGYGPGETAILHAANTRFLVREDSDGRVELRMNDGPTLHLDSLPDNAENGRDAINRALIENFPGLSDHFAQEIDNWANRVASGATVSPIF